MSTELPDRMEKLFPGAIFLPLAFRFAAAFGLMALHLALPSELTHPPIRENYYLLGLLALFLESVWESVRSIRTTGSSPWMAWRRAGRWCGWSAPIPRRFPGRGLGARAGSSFPGSADG